MIKLENKVALVTGAARGIGRATAWLLAQSGCDVAVNYRSSREEAEELVTQIRALDRRALAVQADVSSPDEVESLLERTVAFFGRIDILVNNAGVWPTTNIGGNGSELASFDLAVNNNLRSVFALCNRIVPLFRKQGGGRIINLSSTAGQRGEAHHSAYAATKGGIIAFTKSIAAELAADNILVNAVAPGWVDTDLNGEIFADPAVRRRVAESIPLKRIPKPEEIAGVILFLASDLSAFITGEVINVNGGSVLCG